jgi:hypothetical protein
LPAAPPGTSYQELTLGNEGIVGRITYLFNPADGTWQNPAVEIVNNAGVPLTAMLTNETTGAVERRVIPVGTTTLTRGQVQGRCPTFYGCAWTVADVQRQ